MYWKQKGNNIRRDHKQRKNISSVQVGNNAIASYEYNEYNGKLNKLTYANGLSEEYVYNSIDMLE